jgi:hypothetical protein
LPYHSRNNLRWIRPGGNYLGNLVLDDTYHLTNVLLDVGVAHAFGNLFRVLATCGLEHKGHALKNWEFRIFYFKLFILWYIRIAQFIVIKMKIKMWSNVNWNQRYVWGSNLF